MKRECCGASDDGARLFCPACGKAKPSDLRSLALFGPRAQTIEQWLETGEAPPGM